MLLILTTTKKVMKLDMAASQENSSCEVEVTDH